jgi:hypothetical protein
MYAWMDASDKSEILGSSSRPPLDATDHSPVAAE